MIKLKRSKRQKSDFYSEEYLYERISLFNMSKFSYHIKLINPQLIANLLFRMHYFTVYIHYILISLFLY